VAPAEKILQIRRELDSGLRAEVELPPSREIVEQSIDAGETPPSRVEASESVHSELIDRATLVSSPRKF
jgi:hypothetical protein